MEIAIDLTPIFGSNLVQLDGQRLEQLRNQELCRGLNNLFRLSAESIGAKAPLTTCNKLVANVEQRLYLCWELDKTTNHSVLLGFVKVGRKSLFLYDKNLQPYEDEMLCIFDAYVHRARQRCGIGRQLFDFVFQTENVQPHCVALDCPSVSLLGFFAQAYNVDRPISQNTNFVVFQRLFDSIKSDDSNIPEGWCRDSTPKPIFNNKSNDHSVRYLVNAIPGHQSKNRQGNSTAQATGSNKNDVEETLSQRTAQSRQRKQQLLSSNPLW
ncbi:hypothetical protein M3Y94_00416100 [Aphelenchoides besseyi]|nr:hypothetical protein M3Y94_00416100 [Aphelenchoides besseyi]KAI6229609.1 CBR-MEC-17 protein [Aphelenchoides besseyi]